MHKMHIIIFFHAGCNQNNRQDKTELRKLGEDLQGGSDNEIA